MGLWNSFWTAVSGYDAANQAAGDAADAKNQAINQQLLEDGMLTQDQYDQSVQDYQTGNASTGTDNPQAAIGAAATEGVKEGANNVLTAPGKVVGGVGQGLSTLLGGILKNIPWWAWLVAAGALFVWMGGLELLRGRLAKK
jgi:hypothetical protein